MATVLSTNLNPFAEVVETPKYPFARTLRSNFKQKIRDTYNALDGRFKMPKFVISILKQSSHYKPFMGKSHIGFLDIFSSPLPFLANRFFTWCADHASDKQSRAKRITARVLVGPAFLVNFGVGLARSVIATALTLALLPIVLIVHLISKAVANRLKITIKNNHPTDASGQVLSSTWGQLLKSKGLRLGNIETCTAAQLADGSYDLTFSRQRAVRSGGKFVSKTDSVNLHLTDCQADQAVLTALNKLNVGDIALQNIDLGKPATLTSPSITDATAESTSKDSPRPTM